MAVQLQLLARRFGRWAYRECLHLFCHLFARYLAFLLSIIAVEAPGQGGGERLIATCKYNYRPIPDGYTRLLRLLPHSDKDAPVRCELLDHHLLDSGTGTRPYEALSYVWGPPGRPSVAYIKDLINPPHFRVLPVTENLHDALSRLRDCSLPRVVWVDAICINQEDLGERERQVQLMALIYVRSLRVVVWLVDPPLPAGTDATKEPADAERAAADSNTTLAIQALLSAACGVKDKTAKEVISSLFQRAWFRRIWVLQEIASAQNALIMSRHSEISGQAFCAGLDAFDLDRFSLHPDTRVRAGSAMFLMGGTAFQSRQATREGPASNRFSLGVRPLWELINMFQNREATDRRDKVYALLGMSSDVPTGLSPDYTVPWSDVLRRLTGNLFGGRASVEAWDDSDVSVVTTKARFLGEVDRSANRPNTKDWAGGGEVRIRWSLATRHPKAEKLHFSYVNYGASARRTLSGDILCSIEGVSAPVIVRLYGNYLVLVSTSVTFQDDIHLHATQPLTWSPETSHCYHSVSIIWDWGSSSADLTDSQQWSFGTQLPHGWTQTAETMEGAALLLRDASRYSKAADLCHMAIEAYTAGNGGDDSRTLASVKTLKSIYGFWGDKLGVPAVEDFLQRDLDYLDLPEKRVGLVGKIGDSAFDRFLTRRPRNKQATGEAALKVLAASRRLDRFKLLLDRWGGDINITQDVVDTAARNGRHAHEMVKLILSRQQDLGMTRDIYWAIASDQGLVDSVRHRLPEPQILLEWDEAKAKTLDERSE
ncbi:heterokaryon incompatibility protein-domain-containing protein [Lasiosphaeria ovina]|uniref:Heterokaryon incompatibility protein-domain-containing protein n=1 Tax=Lasiosphaeria ovina TaxID=92902 RepID=A0AAE0K3V2_9PEZI|nr:heterokaryon incompatibility protein-domain-containing protein [Lasiosphaeria ovina]